MGYTEPHWDSAGRARGYPRQPGPSRAGEGAPAGGQGRPPGLGSEGRSSLLTSKGQRPMAPLPRQTGFCRWAGCRQVQSG